MRAFGLLAIPLLARPRGAEGLQVPQDPRSTLDVETKIPQLKIFASTFNAGNTKVEGNEDFKKRAAELMGGHGDYDVIIAGFQEVQVPPQFGRVLFGTDHKPIFHEKFDSGIGCRAASHYDTVLYVTTMGSRWNIEPMRHETPAKPFSLSDVTNFFTNFFSSSQPPPCQLTGNTGCSIDNNRYSLLKGEFECGKAVNLLKFELTPEVNLAQKVHVCAMNTHMSFKGKAKHRAKLIGAAMAEATHEANCDVVVFVGDFNTRLDCDPSASEMRTYPPLRQFCEVQGSGHNEHFSQCKMKEDMEKWDELRVILKGTTDTTCDPGKAHVKKYGFREPEVPQFAPSYKLTPCVASSDPSKLKRIKAIKDTKEMHEDERCYVDDGKLKHRPAWTDRVLYKVPDGAGVTSDTYKRPDKTYTVTIDTYERRIIGLPFETDHAAVIAGLTIDMNPI